MTLINGFKKKHTHVEFAGDSTGELFILFARMPLIDLLIDSPISVLELSDLSCAIAARRYRFSYRQLCKSRLAAGSFRETVAASYKR